METLEQVYLNSASEQGYTVRRRGRFWEVLDPQEELICITVYKRGACEVIRRLTT